MQNKLMALLLCLCNVMLFAHPTYCFKNNTDLDAEINFSDAVEVQQLCGDRYLSEEVDKNSLVIAPGESVLIVSAKKIESFQQSPGRFRIQTRMEDANRAYQGSFADDSGLGPFKKVYGEDIKRAFLITDAELGDHSQGNTE